MSAVLTESAILAMLNLLTEEDAILEEPTLVLFSNPIANLTRKVVMGDLTLCTFGGYTDREALEFGAAFKGMDGKFRMTAACQEYVTTGTGLDQSVRGYAIVNPAKTVVHKVHLFPAAIVLTEAGQGFHVTPEFVYGD